MHLADAKNRLVACVRARSIVSANCFFLALSWMLATLGSVWAQGASPTPAVSPAPATHVELQRVQRFRFVEKYKSLVAQVAGRSDAAIEQELSRQRVLLRVVPSAEGENNDTRAEEDLSQSIDALVAEIPGTERVMPKRGLAKVGGASGRTSGQISGRTVLLIFPKRATAARRTASLAGISDDFSETDPDQGAARLVFE